MGSKHEEIINCTKCGARVSRGDDHRCPILAISQLPSKQEEIREEVAKLISPDCEGWCEGADCGTDAACKSQREQADNVLKYLHSQGVVRKVECPYCAWGQLGHEEIVGMTPCFTCNSTGYIFKPLIEGE